MAEPTVDISILLPAYNEAENLPEVVGSICEVLRSGDRSFEVLVVDDGSTDGTMATVEALQPAHPELRAVRLRRNSGKSAALQVGFRSVAGRYVVLMDADGQDDPREVPRLLACLDDQGLDLVTGRRSIRHDRFVKRNTSKVYNWTTARVTGVPGRDFNSGLKAMRREVADALDMYGELHRYIPVLADWAGFSVDEVDVEHHERLHGRSKFGRARFWRGFLDLFTVKFLTTYTARPFHLFGGLGITSGLLGSVLLVWMAILRLSGEQIGDRPALVLGVLLVVVGIQLVSLGLMAELTIHHRTGGRVDPMDSVEPPRPTT
jgi:dolichol-phosphate mannosyltransferase